MHRPLLALTIFPGRRIRSRVTPHVPRRKLPSKPPQVLLCCTLLESVFHTAVPRTLKRHSSVQLFRWHVPSCVGVSAVHRRRISAPRLALNMLPIPFAGYSVGCLNPQPLREYEGQRFDRSAIVSPHHLPHRSKSKWNPFRPKSTRHFVKTERARPPANQLLARSRVRG
jgi:hypothetical protein